jgi:uncharacterized protein (DUF2252 family)
MTTDELDQRRREGKALRRGVPRARQAEWRAPTDRDDPVRILEEQARGRIAELAPVRYARMAASPFAFYRGSAAIMAADLAHTPAAGPRVQACGDAHLLNFGVFATPERRLAFDLNDFDETLSAPFEWDVKRLAASAVLAAREGGCSPARCAEAARAAVAAYRTDMTALAGQRHLDVWYERIDPDAVLRATRQRSERKAEEAIIAGAQRHTNLGALSQLTTVVDGERRIVDRPPLVEHLPGKAAHQRVEDAFADYARSLPNERRVLLGRYRLVDSARKVVGIGSVGTDTRVLLLLGDRADDPLFLQLKEARASVLEPFAGAACYRHEGERVVQGQRLGQGASDLFLGWCSAGGRDYYMRQLRDMKGSADPSGMSAAGLASYAGLCGAALAHSHARSGDPAEIAGYLGMGDAFDRAVTRFATSYADQVERDHAELLAALRAGRLPAETPVAAPRKGQRPAEPRGDAPGKGRRPAAAPRKKRPPADRPK